MDQGWKRFPLLVILLTFWRCTLGFTGGVYSNTHPRWGQPSDNRLSPFAVQFPLLDAPATGTLPVEEVGSVFPERSQKSRSRFANLRQYVKGGSSSYESASRMQTAPSGLISTSLALPQNERAGSSVPFQLQGASSSSVQDIANQVTSGQSFQNQYVSSQGSSGLQSQDSSQLVSLQGEGSSSGLSSPGVSSQFAPDTHAKISSFPIASSQSTSDQSSPTLSMSSFPGGSGLLLEASGSAFGQGGVGSYGDLSFQSQGTSNQYAPAPSIQLASSPVGVSSQAASDKSTFSPYITSSQGSSALQSAEAVFSAPQQGLSSSPSIPSQDSTSVGSFRPELAGSSSLSLTQELSGSYSGQSPSTSAQYFPGSLTPSKLNSLPLGVSSQPTSAQSLYMSGVPSRSEAPLTASRYVPAQSGSSSRDFSLKPQSTSAQYTPASPKYVPVSSPQAVFGQSGINPSLNRPVAQVGALSQAAASSQFTTTQGGSGYYSGPIPQSQSSIGQYVPASPSKYVPTLSSQGFSSQSTSVVPSQGSLGTLQGTASRYASQGMSSTYSGSVQPQGATSQLAPGSLYSQFSSLPSVSSQSTSDRSVGLLASPVRVGAPPQPSSPITSPQRGSSYYSGLLPQSQVSSGQNAPVSPSKYIPLSSSQEFSSQSAPVQSSRRGLTSTFLGSSGSQSGSALHLQASSTYSGSYSQPQVAVSQFASASPSQYGSMSSSSPQAVASQYSQAPQSVYSSSQSQKPQRWQPSASSWAQGVQTSDTAMSQSHYQPQSAQMPSRFSSSTGGSTYESSPQVLSGGSSQLVSTQGRGGSYGGMSLQSPSTSSSYTPSSPAYAKLGSSSLGFSSQSAGDQSSSSLHSSRSQTRTGVQFASSRYASLQGGSSSAVGSSQPQRISSQYAPAPSFQDEKASASSQYIQASSSGSLLPPSKPSQRLQPSASSWAQGVQTSDTAMSQSRYQPQSAQMSSRFSSTGGSTYESSPQVFSGASSQLVSTQGSGASYGGMSPQSPSTSSSYTPSSPAYAKLGSSSLGFSSQSAGDQSSSSLHSSRSQTRTGVQFASSRYASLQGGSSSAVGSSQPQRISSQYAPAPSFQDEKASVSSQYIQASSSGSVLPSSEPSQRLQPSASSWAQGVQTDTAALQNVPSSSQASSRFSSSIAALSSPVATVAQSSQMPTSVSRRTQGLLGGLQRPSRLSQAAGSTVSSQMLQRPAGSSLASSPGFSAQMSSMGMPFGSSLPQNAQSFSGYQAYNQESSVSVAGESFPFQRFSNYEQSGVGQGTSGSSGFEDSSRSGSLFGQNAPFSSQPSRRSSGRYSSVKG